MKYKINIKPIKEDWHSVSVDLEPRNEPVEGFLMAEVKDNDIAKWYIEGITKVLNGEIDFEKRGGEIYALDIRKDKTRVYDTYSFEFDEPEKIESYIETSELKELILAWIIELEKFNQKNLKTSDETH